jgi:branched-subunit amino acid permease
MDLDVLGVFQRAVGVVFWLVIILSIGSLFLAPRTVTRLWLRYNAYGLFVNILITFFINALRGPTIAVFLFASLFFIWLAYSWFLAKRRFSQSKQG